MPDSLDQLLIALENERRYVARELHDGVAQTTLQLGLQIGICAKLLERGKLEMLTGELAQLEERIRLVSQQIRDIINDMRPPLVAPESGLAEYLQQIIDTHTKRGGPPVVSHFNWSEPDLRLTELQTLTLARLVQEALLNIRKHAKADQVQLDFSAEAETLSLTIADNGQGFDIDEVGARPADQGGAGLANLRARAEAIGGSFALNRTAAGWTEVTVRLPK
jgi:two-component system sensor histidine kinase DegS